MNASSPLLEGITTRDKYDPAMTITGQTEADAYFERCVEHNMSFGETRAQAERTERSNLGYYAGYYDNETRLRVERLFNCVHPVFGCAAGGAPSPKETVAAGVVMGKQAKEQK